MEIYERSTIKSAKIYVIPKLSSRGKRTYLLPGYVNMQVGKYERKNANNSGKKFPKPSKRHCIIF